jgi:ribose transport system substrate-binding protein
VSLTQENIVNSLRHHPSATRLAVGLLASALALSGCAPDASDADSGSKSSEDAAGVRADAQELVDAVAKGTSVLPEDTPRPAAEGKSVVLVPNGMNNASTAVTIDGMKDACEAIGWSCSVIDAQSNPANYAGSIRQAIAQKPDAIVTHGIDCSAVSSPLKEAREAGVITVNSTSYDCEDPLYDGTPLYNDPVDPVDGEAVTYEGYTPAFGAVRGAAIVLGVGDEAPNVIDIEANEVALLTDIHDGTMDFVERIPGAQIHSAEMKLADLGPKLETLVTSELLKNPDANAFSAPFGAAYVAGAGAALERAKRQDLFVMGVEGIPAELDLVRSGVVDAAIYSPTKWTGWAAIDVVNSLLTDAPIVKSGQGWLYVTKDNVPTGAGQEPIDMFPKYEDAYRAAWGR